MTAALSFFEMGCVVRVQRHSVRFMLFIRMNKTATMAYVSRTYNRVVFCSRFRGGHMTLGQRICQRGAIDLHRISPAQFFLSARDGKKGDISPRCDALLCDGSGPTGVSIA